MSPTMNSTSSLHSSAFENHSSLHCDSKDNVLNMSPVTSPSHRRLNNDVHATHFERTLSSYQSSDCCELENQHSVDSGTCASKSSIELMKEIAMIEAEIVHMERHLLSLYRTAYPHPQELPDGIDSHSKLGSPPLHNAAHSSHYIMENDIPKGDIDVHDQASHSYVLAGLHDQISKSSSRRAILQESKSHRSLGDHLGASRMDDVVNFPDKLSEQIVRCISSIYCRLANHNHSPAQGGLSASSTTSSTTSSSSTFSPRNHSGSWSSQCHEDGTRDSDFEGLQGESGPYALMIQVLKLCLDDDSFKYAALTLEKFRSLVKGLEKVDPGKMKREEKLAFWINIHNALVMHAFLAYGTHNYVKHHNSILKAAYNVGGQCINAYEIQHSILGIRTHYHAQWLHTLLSPGKKHKHTYAIEYPEPLIHFALCSGTYCDPAVRVYTAKNVFQELKVSKEEFIQSRVSIHKDSKLYLPKILSHYAKDMSLDNAELVEIVIECLPKLQQTATRTCLHGRPEKHVHWLPRNSSFRYLIHKEISQGDV